MDILVSASAYIPDSPSFPLRFLMFKGVLICFTIFFFLRNHLSQKNSLNINISFKKTQSLSSTWVRVHWVSFNKTERGLSGKTLLSCTPALSSLSTEKITLRNSDSVWAPCRARTAHLKSLPSSLWWLLVPEVVPPQPPGRAARGVPPDESFSVGSLSSDRFSSSRSAAQWDPAENTCPQLQGTWLHREQTPLELQSSWTGFSV